MIKVDESDPVGELEPSFPYKDITIRRGIDMKEHYELQSEIGRGKFGTVFKCREKATGLMLAAKFVGIVHKQDRRNVEREVEIMCELQHPRLIQLYDAFESNNAMCFILELVEGGELFERVIGDDFVLTEKSVTIFMRQICEGVQFIHSKNILHLDLKPENILCLTKTGNRIKIIDFGLARKFNPENKLQVLFGTPEFVAPEVVNFDAIGYGTDMWSVGVICYVLLSGLSPFMGETDVETMANVTIAQYDFDDEAFDSISNDAKDFIKKLLVKDHKSRLTATECLSHRWLQKKKFKKMVRKSSSKKLVKRTEEKTNKEAMAIDQNVPLSLDVSKDNLKEFCNQSRSPSPLEILAMSPSLAQLRIQKDSKLLKAGKDGEPKVTDPTCNKSAKVAVAVIPKSSPDKDCGQVGRLLSTSSCDKIADGTSLTENSSTSFSNKIADGISKTKNTSTSNGLPCNFDELQTTLSRQHTPSNEPQITPEDLQPTLVLPTTSELPLTSGLQPTSELKSETCRLPSTSGLQTASKSQSTVSGLPSASKPQSTSGLQTTSSKLQRVTSEVPNTQSVEARPASAAVDIPSCEINGRNTSTWSQTTLMTNSTCRRSSDVSYMFSSIQTTSTTVSSDFLGSGMQGLSERLQNLQTIFDNRDHATEVGGGNLHRLLLNRQQLTAAVADRKPKFKFTNRDVPLGSPPPVSNLMYYMTSSSCRSAPHSKRASPEHELISAKEMLLKLFHGDKTTEPELSA